MLELKEIGLRVASLRDTCGLSAAEMAEKLEISEDNYNAFEHGEYDFAISTLNNIALILGVDILDIIILRHSKHPIIEYSKLKN